MLNDVAPLPAASVIVLRDGPLEVLLLRRHEKSSFVPNAWVFPGGIAEGSESMSEAAVRETFEEAGIKLDPEQLVWTSRWITPVGIPKRFDTFFFLAKVARDVEVTIDPNEIAGWMWIAPADALSRRDLHLVFPTIKNLEALLGFDSADALIDARRGAVIEPIQPVLVNGKPTLQ
ncbi:MAG TPA: NUDIX hydrolase [Thermoanaerobaculia bacterium]|nr:NUDIX hydrolase [Thermoanaerobaculia bacterium]